LESGTQATTIFIAEDHTLLREGLKALIGGHTNWKIVGEASDGIETLERLRGLNVDLLLIDLSMPRLSGVRVIEEVKRAYPQTHVLVLTGHSDEEFVYAALRAGADGYVVKDSTNEDLATAVKSVTEGKGYLSPSISLDVIRGYLDNKSGESQHNLLSALTRREKEVLQLVVEGHSNPEIADILYISIKTVEKHKTNIMRKLNVTNQNELRKLARSTPFQF